MARFTRFKGAVAAAACCFILSAAHAQDATSGSISGTISDSSGAAVKGATVLLTNTDRNHVERTITTNGAGYYTATALPLGTYSVKITDVGFKSSTVSGLVLHVGDALTVNRSITAGDVNETVNVNADEARAN